MYKGRKFSEEHKKNISKARKGKKLTFEQKRKHMKPLNRDIWNKGKKLTKKLKEKIKGSKRRPSHMIQVDNFCTFFSIKYASEFIGTRKENLTRWLNGSRKNTSKYELKKVGEIILYNYKTHILYLNTKIIKPKGSK